MTATGRAATVDDQAVLGHNQPVAGATKFDPGVYVRILRVHGTPGHVIIPTFDERRAG